MYTFSNGTRAHAQAGGLVCWLLTTITPNLRLRIKQVNRSDGVQVTVYFN